MANEAMKAHDMVGGGKQMGMSREARRPKKKHVKRLTIAKAKNGGHVIEHEFESGMDMPYEPNAQHVFGPGDGAKALAHIARHAGIKAKPAGDEGDEVNSAPDSEPKEKKATPTRKADPEPEEE